MVPNWWAVGSYVGFVIDNLLFSSSFCVSSGDDCGGSDLLSFFVFLLSQSVSVTASRDRVSVRNTSTTVTVTPTTSALDFLELSVVGRVELAGEPILLTLAVKVEVAGTTEPLILVLVEV